jgi:LPS sulfotransferase NodH
MKYAIIRPARSGSGYLSELLCNTGIVGNPKEHFFVHGLWNPTPDQIADLIYKEKDRNDIFGTVGSPEQIQQFTRHETIDKWIILTRLTRIEQAISFYLCKLTNRWRYFKHQEAPEIKPEWYNFTQIKKAYVELWIMERECFNMASNPLWITYEGLCGNPDGTVRQVVNFLINKELPEELNLKTRIKVQRNALTCQWADRFEIEVQATGTILPC